MERLAQGQRVAELGGEPVPVDLGRRVVVQQAGGEGGGGIGGDEADGLAIRALQFGQVPGRQLAGAAVQHQLVLPDPGRAVAQAGALLGAQAQDGAAMGGAGMGAGIGFGAVSVVVIAHVSASARCNGALLAPNGAGGNRKRGETGGRTHGNMGWRGRAPVVTCPYTAPSCAPPRARAGSPPTCRATGAAP